MEQLKLRLGSEYAGLWFDAEAGKFVVPVATAGSTPAAARMTGQEVAEEFTAASLGGTFRTVQVQSSRAELDAAQVHLNERLSAESDGELVQTAIDPATNAVIVRVPEGIGTDALEEIEKTADASTAKVEVRRKPDELFQAEPTTCNEAERKCDLPIRSGQVIYGPPFQKDGLTYNEVCSVGFRANGTDGRKYILTAGHCAFQEAILGKPINWTWTTDTPTEGNAKSVGTLTQWHYDGRDWAKIDATGTWADTAPWPTIGAYWGTTQEYPIVGEAKSYKGQTLCHIGANTGASCGIVKEEDVDGIYYGNGATVGNMFEVGGVGLALGGGDSGGPVVANNLAYGIVSGGVAAFSFATVFFSDIGAANSELGTNLVGPGAPEAVTGGTTGAVGNTQATVSGQINPHGLPTNYQVEYGVGSYTHSTSPIGGGSGQGFGSVFVNLTGLEPNTTYQYRLKATNGLNSAYGKQGSFKTDSVPSVDGNLPTIDISAKQATIRASVRPNKAETTYWFEWGPTSSMGKETPLKSAGAALGPVEVRHTLTGLSPLTKYWYRVIVSNAGGIAVGPTGTFTTAAAGWTYLSRFGTTGSAPGQFKGIAGLAVDAGGNFYVADRNNHRVQKFAPSGEFLLQFGVKGSGPGQFSAPAAIAVDSEGDVWVAEENNQRIQEFSSTGTFIRQIGPNEGSNRPKVPVAMTIGGNGRVYVADQGSPESILEYSPTPNGEGKYFLKRMVHEWMPMALTTAPDGTPYFISREKFQVMKITSGTIGTAFTIPTNTTPAISDPSGLEIDADGNFLISNGNGSVIQLGATGPTGVFQGAFGTKGTGPGQMNLPAALALAPSGLLFVGNKAGTAEITRWAN